MRALGRLKNLEFLDGIRVTDEEMTIALKMAAASRPSSFAILAHARTDQSKPRTLSLVPTAQAILANSQNKPVKLVDDDSQWFIKVTRSLDFVKLWLPNWQDDKSANINEALVYEFLTSVEVDRSRQE